MLVMRAISLGLLRGNIDQVDETFSVTWVQPRILDLTQISEIGVRINDWSGKVKTAMLEMESGITSDLIS